MKGYIIFLEIANMLLGTLAVIILIALASVIAWLSFLLMPVTMLNICIVVGIWYLIIGVGVMLLAHELVPDLSYNWK